MIDAVFISDLHLHPDDSLIQARFDRFVDWAKLSVKQIYILGDFFHLWVGDDAMNEWSRGIANQLYSLTTQGISISYLHGNRDFLLGPCFAQHAGWTVISEPTIIQLGDKSILLAHGDRYCTQDIVHQRFRRLTRNRLFSTLFLSLPLKYRQQWVNRIRLKSMSDTSKSAEQMDVVAKSVIEHMLKYNVKTLIHGHTHKPGLIHYNDSAGDLNRYILSDWDDNPQILCYDHSKGLYFTQL